MKNLLTLLLVFSFASSVYAKTYAPVSVDIKVHKVSEHIYFVPGLSGVATDFEGFISNAGFVITNDGVVVFDALGTPSLAWEMLKKIREITDKPILKVILSHYHADHIYGLQVFKEAGAEIIAPAGSLDYIESPQAAERLEERRFSLDPWVNEKTYIVNPDIIIDSNTELEIGGMHFRLNYLGKAHSDGDLSMYVVEDRVLFSGDIIFEGRIPFVGDADTRLWLESIEKMRNANLAVLIPGHGGIAENPDATLALTRDYLAYIRKVMGDAVEELIEFKEAYEGADWSKFEKFPAFDLANRVNAYAVYLAIEQEGME